MRIPASLCAGQIGGIKKYGWLITAAHNARTVVCHALVDAHPAALIAVCAAELWLSLAAPHYTMKNKHTTRLIITSARRPP